MAFEKINGTAFADIAKFNGIAVADIASINGSDPPSSTPTIVTDNLFFWFGPDDITGSTANDKNGGSVGAVMSNGASVVTSLRSDGSFYSDGVNDAIHAGYSTSQLPSTTAWPATAEAWLYPPSGGKNVNVISFNDDASGVDWLRLMLDSRNNNEIAYWQFYANQGSKYAWVKRDVDFPTVNGSDWVYMSATFELVNNATFITAYLNGVSVGTATTSFTGSLNVPPWANQTTGFNLGINYITRIYRGSRIYGYYGQAHTGDVRLYTDKLTAAEILNNYNVQKTSYGH
jgi:hypothetical protein